jgi:multiple sugar transport system ATP-binding protein
MGGITVRPSDAQMRAAQGHANLIVGVRPEHMSIGEGDLKLQVDLVEDLGSDFYVYGHLAEGAATNVIVRADREHPRPGEAIKIKPDAAQLHLFDAATGLRVGD